jgi:hypothetical protein
MTSEPTDPVDYWLSKEITPAVEEASLLLYEFSRLELRDVVSSHEMLWKLVALNHRLGLLYADAVELRSEYQTQCDEIYARVILMLGGKGSEYKLTTDMAKSAGELATSNISALESLFPSVVRSLNLISGNEPKRKCNRLSATVDKLKSIQRDMQESINGIKHLGNRELQHVVHGI